jgi:hypothetical protein
MSIFLALVVSLLLPSFSQLRLLVVSLFRSLSDYAAISRCITSTYLIASLVDSAVANV